MGWKVKRRERHALIEVDEVNPRVHRGTFHIGPRHVKHHTSKQFVEHAYAENPDFASEKDCRVFAQCSNIAVEVYDFYNKLFDPDYKNVSVYDERFEVQYLFKEKPKETWRSVDYYNPRIEVIPLNDGVDIKKVFDTDYGSKTLEITYTVRTGACLKHTIIFTNKTTEQKTFRVVMKLAGITSDNVKHAQFEERITKEKHIVAPAIFFGEDNQRLKLSEYLWSLGEMDEEAGEWSPTTLRDIILNTHAQGSTADIIIGNYTLAKNDSLLIDPASDTWQVSAGTDDAFRRLTDDYWSTSISFLLVGRNDATYYRQGCGLRFLSIGILQGLTIESAYLKVVAYTSDATTPVNTRISADDVDSAATFSTAANFDTRYAGRTTARVDWDITAAWTLGVEYTSPDIKTVIQEIVDRGGWASNNAIALFWEDFDNRSLGNGDRRTIRAYDYIPSDAAQLEITWTSFAPTVTTQAADGLGIGAGTLHGTITDTGGENADERGFDWDYDTGEPYAYEETDLGDFGVGAFEEALTGLTQGNTVYFRAKAHNSAGWGYGGELNFVVRKAVTRSASAAIGIVGTSGRQFIGERSASASFSMNGTPSRILSAFRSAPATLGMTGIADRILHAFRSAPAALGIVGITGRVLHAFRSAGAAIGVTGATNRILHASRSASGEITIQGVSGRVFEGVRSAEAGLSMTGTAGRSWIGTRIASATLNLVGTPVRSWIGTRTASAALSMTGVAGRILHAFRSAGATIGVIAVAVRGWVGTRTASASMAVVGTASRMLHSIRSASASMNQVAVAIRTVAFTRIASGEFTIQGVSGRTLHAFRTAAAAISSTAIAGRMLSAFRNAPASMNVVAVAKRAVNNIRKAAAAFTVTATAGRVVNNIRTAAAAMAMQGVAGRAVNNIRSAAAAISVSAVAGRVVNNVRSAPASMTLVAVGKRTYQGVRSAAASMSMEAVGSLFKHILAGVVTLRFAGKTRILDFVDKERTLILSAKLRVLDLADKIRRLSLGRKET